MHSDIEIGQAELEGALEILESPWPRREEVMLRELFEKEGLADAAKSREIVAFIRKSGLEPFRAPEPLPPIEEDDIHLIGWIALEPV